MLIKIKDKADELGVSVVTLRRWHKIISDVGSGLNFNKKDRKKCNRFAVA